MSEIKSFSIKKYLVKTNMICIFFFKCCSTIRSINVNPNFFKITKVSLSNPGLQLWLTFCVRNYVIVFFHHHQELKPRPLSQNVLKFLEMSTNNVLQKSSQILRSLSSWEYCWVCCSFFPLKVLSKRWLKLSSAVLLDKIFWQISGILEVLLKLHCLFVTIKKQLLNL